MNKKIFIAALALLSLSCSKQQESTLTTDGGARVFKITAYVDETKTTIGKDGSVYKIYWATGDKISVNKQESNAVSSSDNGKKSVNFTVTLDGNAPYKVLYPANTSSDKVVSLPATQNYVAGSFDPYAAPMYGNATKSGADEFSVKLSNFCGMLRFALNGSATLDRIEINALGGEKLYGNFTLDTNDTGFNGEFSGGTAGTLTCDLNDLVLSNTDTPIYVPIPAQTYSSGLEALVYQSDGAFMRLKFWGSSSVDLQGSDIAEFESKTFAAGRTENIFTINSLVAEDGGEPTATPPGITVGVYNIKMAENRSGDNSTYISMDRADVQAGLGSSIAGMAADIFGINEIGADNMPGQSHDVKAWAIAQGLSSSNYTWKMNYPNKVDRDGNWLSGYSYSATMYYANVFAYNNTTIVVEDDGYVWLCNDADDYWSSMENAYEHSTGRHTAVYALCRHKVSGKRFWFIVTHFDTYYGNDDGDNLHNVKSFKIFAQHLKNDVEDLPIIAVGDLNFGPKEQDKTTDCPNYGELTSYWTDAYDKVKADGNMTDYYKTYDGTQSGSQHSYYYPFITFTKNHPDRRLDHIVTKNSASHTVNPITYRTVRRTYEAEDENTWCPSDHLPVVSYITFD